jgi:hypothetical protein
MFDTRLNINGFPQFEPPRPLSYGAQILAAVNLFNQARWKSGMEKRRSLLLRRPCELLDLHTLPSSQVRSRCYGGLQPVSIDQICGSLGRVGDFDRRFHPRSDRLRDRWISVVLARRQNIPLEAVELIQVGQRYFVRDGHHRISVARALGETTIDAEVTAWEVSGPLPWEPARVQPAARWEMLFRSS